MEIDENRDVVRGRFSSFGHGDRHRYSLLRGCSLQDPSGDSEITSPPPVMCPPISCRRRSIEYVAGGLPRLPNEIERIRKTTEYDEENMDFENEEKEIQSDNEKKNEKEKEQTPRKAVPAQQHSQLSTRRATMASGMLGRYRDMRPAASVRDWPLGLPRVRDDDDCYELEFDIGNFAQDEVSAKLLGKDLIIHCKSETMRQVSVTGQKAHEIFRCYTLPLPFTPGPSDVSIVIDGRWLRVAVRKEPRIKSPVSGLVFTPELAEELDEDGADMEAHVDVDEEHSNLRGAMEDL